MTLSPDNWERTVRALTELRMGLPVVLFDGERRALVAAAESLNATRLSALRDVGHGHIALTAHRARVLNAMVYDTHLARIRIPQDADISWVRAMADPSLDLTHPMKGPFSALRDGTADLEEAAVTLCKRAHLLPTAVVFPVGERGFPDLLSLDVRTLKETPPLMSRIASARVPLAVSSQSCVHVFGNGTDFSEHYAVEIGEPRRDAPVLCRLHSACFTGDILGSLKCDCGAQLDAALDQIAREGSGVLLYLNQEGRGIGLANKMRAYALQDQGYDTVEANHRLGFEDDERDFEIGANILSQMGFDKARLMTNNPAKVEKMETAGVKVAERVPHQYGETDQNRAYLKTKAAKSGHLL